MKSNFSLIATIGLSLLAFSLQPQAEPQLKALIIDGQNNHNVWPKSTFMMKDYLEETGLFSVDIARTQFTWNGAKWIKDYPLPDGKETVDLKEPKSDPDYKPDFSKYNVVISNFGWRAADWPVETQTAFVDYVKNGGGVVIVHAADNSFGDWDEFNRIIGVGGWGGRNEKSGPNVYYDAEGKLVRDMSTGNAGSHGPQHEFLIQIRDESHPITKGMPKEWLHAQDELYDRLRGPAERMHVLATAYSAPDKRGTGHHEPMLMTIEYGKGRVFHTPMGHEDYSFECVGLIVSLQRGAEWAATGKVTQTALPADFPERDKVSRRPYQGK